ncbi:Sec34-domain-containing protein [Hymenopellis radicata]|nr:Sec34-domain-containing protein [Hymenopellis radicata]
MATRTAPRRAPTLIVPTTSKSTVNLEDWEAKAPLDDLEIRSIGLVKTASETLPLPLKYNDDENFPSRPSTPKTKLLGPNSRPGTTQFPVQTPQQFYDWFAVIDRSVLHSQEAHFRAHVASVSDHLSTCDFLLERINEIDHEVDQMLQGWTSVEEGGKSLKDACERLLEERDRLLQLTDEIGTRLEYFQELEHATRMLNHPGESLVLQSDFLYMVERVDICIDYLKSHRHFREAEVYLLRFQQCMTRAMTLIKMYFVGSLRALSADISRRLSEKDVSSTAQMHLLYTRFKSVSPQLSPLLRELERRASTHHEELASLLSECHTAYLSTRKSLLVGRLMQEIKGLDPTRTELVALTRTGCSYLKDLCVEEFDLFRVFFNSGEDQLYQYLENLCDYLYDDLRPRILHEPRLTALCEVCTVLQALMVLDRPDVDLDDEDGVDELNLDLDGKRRGLHRLHISQLLEMVLQDAQTRLFFKAQSVIQTDIRYYVTKPEDLAYPDILLQARKPASALDLKEKQSISEIFTAESLAKQDTWFPTLQKTYWVLSQLRPYVKPAIFEDISQEALSLCQQSLVSASEIIKMKNPPTTNLDGQLFYINFSGVTDALASMLSRTTALLPDALFSTFGVPRGDGSIGGVKHGIDHELRRVCSDVIAECALPISTPLRTWLDRVNDFNAAWHTKENDGATPLTAQPWASQAAAEELNANFRSACERDLRSSVVRLKLYLENDRTVGVLVQHAMERIVDEYLAFRGVAWNMYAGALRSGLLDEHDIREVLKTVTADPSS